MPASHSRFIAASAGMRPPWHRPIVVSKPATGNVPLELRAAKGSDGELLGFCGVSDGNIEMLFIAPEARGQGVGARLTAYAIEHQGATKVDVNEQNVQALGFYEHVGFAVDSRSPVDGQGKPYPLLHMELAGR